MKRFTLLAIIILLSVAPVSADPAQSSFYRPFITNATGQAVYNDEWRNFLPSAFDTRIDGLFVMQADGQFTTDHIGLVTITGNCKQGKQSLVGIRLLIDGYSVPYMVAKTGDEVFTFSSAFHAGDFYLQGYNYDAGRYDVLKCDVVLEVVE